MRKIIYILFLFLPFSVNAQTSEVPLSLQKNKPIDEVKAGVESEVATEDKNNEQEKIIVLNSENKNWTDKKEPKKSDKNLVRITYKKDVSELSELDEIALKSVLKLIKDDNIKSIIVNSYSSKYDDDKDARSIALFRALEVRGFLKRNQYDIQNVSYNIHGNNDKKFNIDYIDIDKN
jgi:outer membrane protein OmpA-like peptidoglycan-associated protein